ncbi:hypothetical protein [Variovorax ginsengisoli]|uniref:Uncharacterized protein n=1 Tax=Variovorax ginsengisoli TaxID=363844 RepID=A0ABT8SA65_9BURK|nr:hypothetical protein [Variovorax ginsengisoli]MDN8616495.1 hypothetical protein [Variovorax ginsengisoli]MDO1535665.1 hypothetical protein [Variovorax ginsengisoli]
MLDFAMMSAEEALEQTLVLAARAKEERRLGAPPVKHVSLAESDLERLRDCLLAHVENLGHIELSSPTMVDVYLNTAARSLIEEAQAAGVCTKPGLHWFARLGSVCMVLFADEQRLRSVDSDHLVALAHESAIRTAQKAGRPFNSQALATYEARAAAANHGERIG